MVSRFSGAAGRDLRISGDFPGHFSTHVRYCSVDTELTDGNNCAKNYLDGSVAAIKYKDNFLCLLLFNSPLSKALDPRKHRMSAFTEIEHHNTSDFVPFSIRFVNVSSVPLLL